MNALKVVSSVVVFFAIQSFRDSLFEYHLIRRWKNKAKYNKNWFLVSMNRSQFITY